ncbi:uncharacterized protein LOC129589020 [Paramacrobiotus metropolitanus]|uniref:uncharacterized protein LOC129589020 n=1 Tax=Paramacrobiotus metropolitanus TaxID=2943436 RepID=UPI002445F7D0|nr:uncharacterized protein LOC129589020 [Paramacrobiotus metropolitanus]
MSQDPSSFGNCDRGLMTICKLKHDDFQMAVRAITKWNNCDFPNIATYQERGQLSRTRLNELCRRYNHDLDSIAQAFKRSLVENDFQYISPRGDMVATHRLVQAHAVGNAERKSAEDRNHDSQLKKKQRKRFPTGEEAGMELGANDAPQTSPKLQLLPEKLSSASPGNFPGIPYETNISILKSLLAKHPGHQSPLSAPHPPLHLHKQPRKSAATIATQTDDHVDEARKSVTAVGTQMDNPTLQTVGTMTQ